MKAGMRTPSVKRSVKARTTGRIKRSAKSVVNPLYGKKGMGYLKDPERAIKNSIYHKTTIGLSDINKTGSSGSYSTGNSSGLGSGFIQEDIRRDKIEMSHVEIGMFTSIVCAALAILMFVAAVVSFSRSQAIIGILFAAVGVFCVRPLFKKIKN